MRAVQSLVYGATGSTKNETFRSSNTRETAVSVRNAHDGGMLSTPTTFFPPRGQRRPEPRATGHQTARIINATRVNAAKPNGTPFNQCRCRCAITGHTNPTFNVLLSCSTPPHAPSRLRLLPALLLICLIEERTRIS